MTSSRLLFVAVPLTAALLLGSCVFVLDGTGMHSSLVGGAHSQRTVWSTTLTQTEDWQGDVDSIAVRIEVGDVTVQKSDSNELSVVAEVRSTRQMPPKQRMSQLAHFVSVQKRESGGGTQLVIEDRFDDILGDGDGWSVDLVVSVPVDLPVHVATGVGDVDIESAMHDVRVEAGVGDIDLRLAGGAFESIELESSVGSVRLTAGGVTSELDVRADVGDVEVELDSISGRSCDLTSSVGDIVARFGSIELPGGAFRAQSGTGSIDLEFPRGVEGNFDLQSGVGDVDGEGELGLEGVNQMTSEHVQGKVGLADTTFHVRSGVGDVEIRVR